MHNNRAKLSNGSAAFVRASPWAQSVLAAVKTYARGFGPQTQKCDRGPRNTWAEILYAHHLKL